MHNATADYRCAAVPQRWQAACVVEGTHWQEVHVDLIELFNLRRLFIRFGLRSIIVNESTSLKKKTGDDYPKRKLATLLRRLRLHQYYILSRSRGKDHV